ncbi:MAG TPA: PAS domain S-box protein [Flavisolibacter sp.]|nr:PAS domain S-box protein [Flavisolibacter sp.]
MAEQNFPGNGTKEQANSGFSTLSEEHQRLLIESAKDYAIFTLDAGRKVIDWSIGAQLILGYTEAEIIGKSGDIIFVPEDRENGVPEKEAQAAVEKGRAENERWHLHRDGSRFWGSGMTHPLYGEDEKLIGFVKIMRDLTANKRLEETKFFLASIVETSNDSIITIDFQRTVTSWNKAAENLYGYPAKEAIGKNLTMLTLPEDFKGLLAKVDAVEHSREVVVFDTVRRRKGGQLIDLEIVMSPVLTSDGKLIGISTIARDVSSRKRRESNLAFLARINLGFAPLLSIHDVMDPVSKQLADYLQLNRCHFSLIDEEADRVEVIHEFRRDETLRSIKNVQHISDKFSGEGRRHLSSGQLVVMNTVAETPLSSGGASTLKSLGFGSLVYVPHLEGGRWCFLLTAGRAEEGEWRSDELELLQELASKLYIRIERARAEEALQASENRLQSITNLVPDLLWDGEPDGSTSWYNQRWLEYTGQSLEEATGWGWMEVIHPEDRETSALRYYEAVENGEALRQEHRIRRYDGEYRWFVVSAFPHKDESGRVIKMYGAATDIHESRVMNEALGESEALLRTLANAVPQLIWKNDTNGNANYFNQRWYEYSGLSYEQSKGLGWQAIVHPGDAPGSVEKWNHALSSGEVFDTEYRLRSGDGSYHWFIGRNVPVRDEWGRITGWFGSATDIENLKNTEEALSQSEARLKITMESATDYAIITMDTQRRVEKWSKGAEALLGYTEEEMAGQFSDIIFTEEDLAAHAPQKEMEMAKNTGRAADERWHRRKDGSRFFASGVLRPIQNTELTGYVKVLSDVTEQKEAEERLRIMEERYRIALESAELAAWDWNIAQDNVQWNDQHYFLLGLQPDTSEKPASYFLGFVHPDDRERVTETLMQAVRSLGGCQADFRVVCTDGEVRWMSGYGRVVASQHGSATRMVGVMFDITQQKLFTEELSRLVAEQTVELQRSNEDLRQFAHVASHDLKEPIRKIQTFNNRILDEYGDVLPERAKTFSEKIGTAADRMILMVEGVLRYSKLGNIEQVWEAVPLDELIPQIAVDLEVLIQQGQAEITTRDLPVIQGNPTLMYQLFYNLILNSLKFARKEEPSRIIISSEMMTGQEERFAKIILSDNGIGFEPEYSQEIFKTFVRLHPAEDFEGTGLGLALCKKIVERHGGAMSASGDLGKGAVFTMLLPLANKPIFKTI